ncbi:hypothetical protein CLOAM0376 [Candidatus Cloacimonas acidaminovorans str. Evry]|uniref:Uncharacterized protein n=1 Tax=Cloacimonas acidaminovorans (strain Evry) TaxID=459349 RepID=B0VG63_CLOAI|nr:hypothetical protein CLOAM0376 [Candidatus Cloacimonas acidaminovorans str. Evry]
MQKSNIPTNTLINYLYFVYHDLLYSLQIITANLALFPEGGKNEANLYIHLNNSVCKFLIFLSGS